MASTLPFLEFDPSSQRPLDVFRTRPDVVSKLGKDVCTGFQIGVSRFGSEDSNCDRGMHLYLALKQVVGTSLVADGFRREPKNNHFRLVAPSGFSPFATEICFTRGSVDGDLVEFNRKGTMFQDFIRSNGAFMVQGELDFGFSAGTAQSRLLLVIDIREDAVSAQGYSGSIYLVDGEFARESAELMAINDLLLVSHFPDLGDFSSGHYEAPSLG